MCSFGTDVAFTPTRVGGLGTRRVPTCSQSNVLPHVRINRAPASPVLGRRSGLPTDDPSMAASVWPGPRLLGDEERGRHVLPPVVHATRKAADLRRRPVLQG